MRLRTLHKRRRRANDQRRQARLAMDRFLRKSREAFKVGVKFADSCERAVQACATLLTVASLMNVSDN